MNQRQSPTIPVVTGTGTGSTELSAFDAALRDAGVANFNLVRLSSVVPPHTVVDTTGATPIPDGAWGDRLYCVYAEQRASVPGEQAWAGVGWVQRVDGAGGLFVEHEGDSEEIVTKLIDLSLADLVAGRPEEFGPVQQVRTGVTCTEEPVCAMVVAAYETAGWGFTR
ncbi:arginine decarboxylase [Klenkia soli]|uniref:Pyruvoyl-dependent arginine decarboxylase AaxB n=1 Tax=Klenkia soli TaxID=1052260 RepID=A0A1H0QXL6_9ACTN|nr:pyruvoyl-dependent arginine decarboxylase [Klenkia soli]SDP22032.1 arginine decarboxylase [Klenkia soli]